MEEKDLTLKQSKIIEFTADKIKVRTGSVDNGAVVSFDVGEYQVEKLKELIGIVDKELKVKVEYD